MEMWYPFAFYSPDPACFVADPESLVWHGKLCSILYDWGYEADPQIHFGSKFMKAPIMQPGDYTVKLYYYDKHTLSFTHDHGASTCVTVMLDMIGSSLVTLEENVATVMTKIGEIQVDISDLNAKVVNIEGNVATISTDVGIIQTDITNIDAKVVSMEGNVATIETNIGTVKESADALNAAIVSLQDDVVTIHTDVGGLQVKLSEINGIVEIEDNIATITTDLGTIKGQVTSLDGRVAEIETDIGTIREEADLIKGSVALQPASITLSLIAALAAVAAAALILRKVYLK
jgi:chaperonin cofactor prefoldin